ncbi:MAG: hypothetical protein A4E55_02232 [Pelotomaculum sp. PtaU1.Bin035]|nr:MAG: hypothetical protein A4E55_02232 [Pelotomaculum sp. PtaU1.Bin035]
MVMKNIDELTNKFNMIEEIYKQEKDPKIKVVYLKRLLQIANEVGNIVYQNQAIED